MIEFQFDLDIFMKGALDVGYKDEIMRFGVIEVCAIDANYNVDFVGFIDFEFKFIFEWSWLGIEGIANGECPFLLVRYLQFDESFHRFEAGSLGWHQQYTRSAINNPSGSKMMKFNGNAVQIKDKTNSIAT